MGGVKKLALLIVAGLLLFGAAGTAWAFPPLPSSFYGEIQITDGPPAVGDQVLATVPGVASPAGSATIQTFNGQLVYTIDVRGDDEDTPAKDGGDPGDLITFTIGGRVVATATWISGTNVNLVFHPPDAALTNNGPVAEGSPVTVDAGGSTDWGTDIASYAFDCDNNGSYEIGPQAGATANCTFGDGPSSRTVGVRVVDAQGGVSTDTTTVTVNNVAPTATFNAPTTVAEGDNINLSLTNPVDVPADTLTYAFDCGGGYGPYGAAGTATCATDDDGLRTVKGKIRDKDGDETEYSASVTITDVQPASNAGGPYSGGAGQPVTLTGTPTCVPVDACSVEWFFGATSLGTANSVSYTWNAAGSYTVTFRVTDNDGNVANANATVTISAAAHAITLQPGWNLVSFNLIPANTSITAVLASIADDYDLVYAWDATTQTWLKADNVPASPDTLVNLTEKMGFWINVTAAGPVTLTVQGDVPTSTAISLLSNGQGWNLVGYPARVSRALPGALAGTGFTLAYSYRANDPADPWKLYDAGAPSWSNDLTALDPGWGYWVKVSTNSSWIVAYE